MNNETIYREAVGAGNWNYWTYSEGHRVLLSSNRAMTLARRDGYKLVSVDEQIKKTPQAKW